MNCVVYKSDRKPDTYLYLADYCEFQELPGELQEIFGAPVRVMRLELSRKSRLARVDASAVRQELEKNGYFLQLPPGISTEEEIAKQFS
ncbi:MAG: YcgL domain-containing protein [Lysobacterales bacterium]